MSEPARRRVARPALALALLWLVGANLRTVLLGVPPTLPTLHQSLHLSYGAAGLLTSLPVLLMAAGAIPGALLVSRVGARRSVALGLGLVALGAGLRGGLPLWATLFGFTVLLSLGIALVQPAIPSVIQAWFPGRIGRATAIYSNGILVGEVIAATVTLPFLLGRLGLGWQGALAAWSLPAVLCLAAWLVLTPPSEQATSSVRQPWWPDLRSRWNWRLGWLMGGASLIYFGMNAWIPDTLQVRGAGELIPVTLGLLNFMQLPVSATLAVFADVLLGRRWPYLLAGVGCVVALLGYALAPAETAPAWAGILGAGASLVFVLNLGLVALLAPQEVARVSGLMFTVGYGCAFFGPSLGGAAWDLTGLPFFALLPVGLAAAALIWLGAGVSRSPVRQPAPVVVSGSG